MGHFRLNTVKSPVCTEALATSTMLHTTIILSLDVSVSMTVTTMLNSQRVISVAAATSDAAQA